MEILSMSHQGENMNPIFKTSDGKDLHWGWKTVILILGTILFGMILSAILMTALTAGYVSQGLPQAQSMEKATLASGGFVPQVVLSVLQLGFMLWLVRWLITKVEKQNFRWSNLGLVTVERSKHITLGIVLAVLLSLSTIGIGFSTGTLKYVGNGFELFTSTQVTTSLLLATVLALASGFGEEIAYRGYLQSRIAQRYNPTVAVMIVAVLFALSHPPTASNPFLYLATAVLVGLLFGMIFVRTSSLWMGITLHTVWNYIQIAILAVRNSADERFFGSPLFIFDNLSGSSQMLIEFGVILLWLLFTLWMTKPTVKIMRSAWQEK
jgi:membrane protease YdiL (CAAX protease family)